MWGVAHSNASRESNSNIGINLSSSSDAYLTLLPRKLNTLRAYSASRILSLLHVCPHHFRACCSPVSLGLSSRGKPSHVPTGVTSGHYGQINHPPRSKPRPVPASGPAPSSNRIGSPDSDPPVPSTVSRNEKRGYTPKHVTP